MPWQIKGGYTTNHPNLDRVPGWDTRNESYRVHPVLLAMPAGGEGLSPKPRTATYKTYVQLNQGQDGACVGFAHTQAACTAPKDKAQKDLTFIDATNLYHQAQMLDDIPGQEPEVQGSTTLAGAKAAVQAGYYTSYLWARNLTDIQLACSYMGPVVIGISWYDSMFHVINDTISISPEAQVAGGHDTLLNGVDVEGKRFRLHNSWGPEWGDDGEVWISFTDIDRLINEPDSDACVPLRKVINVRTEENRSV